MHSNDDREQVLVTPYRHSTLDYNIINRHQISCKISGKPSEIRHATQHQRKWNYWERIQRTKGK